MINTSGREQWAILIIELIALIFKNQHVDHMSKLLRKTIISDSSEDNESNTSSNPVIIMISIFSNILFKSDHNLESRYNELFTRKFRWIELRRQ